MRQPWFPRAVVRDVLRGASRAGPPEGVGCARQPRASLGVPTRVCPLTRVVSGLHRALRGRLLVGDIRHHQEVRAQGTCVLVTGLSV